MKFDSSELKKLYMPLKQSHKGQNGKLMIIGGSHLFHGASLWALKVASRIVDMVFYASVPENLEFTKKLKSEIYDFIAIPRDRIDEYIEEADAVLLGPGLPRDSGKIQEEDSTRELTHKLLTKHPKKRWIIDAGSLTEIDADWFKKLDQAIITPHHKEFAKLFGVEGSEESVLQKAKEFNITILLKGPTDIVCDAKQCIEIEGANAGMTKGGTGDVMAGLVAALSSKNDLFLAAASGAYINKKAGESLEKRVGPYFNASDLADEIPRIMKELLV